MRSVKGRRVLVTGATGGIGRAIARSFVDAGAQVILSGRRADALEALAASLGASETLVADLAVSEDVAALAASAGAVDIVVANAGLPGTGQLTELTQPQIDTLLQVNLAAPIALTHAVLPGMLARGSGHLVYIASVSGQVASAHASMYNATKFGLRGFTFGLRADLHGSGVSASVISPGFISDAGMFHDSGVTLPPGVGTRTPEQVAAAVRRAVRFRRAEITVAPFSLRAGAAFGAVAPGISEFAQRLAGGEATARAMSEAQRGNRPTG